MTTIKLAGSFWLVENAGELAIELLAKPEIARQVLVLGCESCRALCTIGHPCECCAKIGRAFGGKRVRGLQALHDRFPIGDVLDQLRGRAA